MLILPVINYPHFTQQITLDGLLYTFEFNWNSRGEYWTLTIYNQNSERIIAGVKVILNFDLTGRYTKITLPPGILLSTRENDDVSKIADGELGNLVNLFYVTEAERAAI
jgi:hypothetical protein